MKMKGVYELPDGSSQPYKITYNSGSPMFMVSVSVPLWNWGQSCKKKKEENTNYRSKMLDCHFKRIVIYWILNFDRLFRMLKMGYD